MSDGLSLNRNCFVTTLGCLGVKKLGLESLDWDPFILRDAFEEAYGLSHLSQRSFDKLNCAYMLIGTDAFTSTLEGFLSATKTMNNRVFDEDEAPFCSLSMCAWSIWEYMNLVGDMADTEYAPVFDPSIVIYIQELGRTNGCTRFPSFMRFADVPDHSVPDMSGDISQFEMYNKRQDEYIERLTAFVQRKQQELTAELAGLRAAGLLGEDVAEKA